MTNAKDVTAHVIALNHGQWCCGSLITSVIVRPDFNAETMVRGLTNAYFM